MKKDERLLKNNVNQLVKKEVRFQGNVLGPLLFKICNNDNFLLKTI